MWVSGSLMRSRTWRSSSVSAPCISSSISLPRSAARSRTMRGNFCQTLPTGCMRVFITPSCSSAVTLESRCSGQIRGTGCFPKCPLDLVERHFAWTKGTFQYLVDQRSTRGPRNRDCALGGRAGRHALEQVDQVPVRPFWFSLAVFELDKDLLDAIDGGENERDGLGGDGKTIAKPAHQRLRRMRKRLQPRQSEKSAGAFDRVDQAEDVVEDLGVVRILLEADQLDVDDVEALIGLGQEFAQQFVHGNAPGREATRAACPAPVASEASLLGNGLRLVAPLPKRCGGRQIPGAFRPSEPAAGRAR